MTGNVLQSSYDRYLNEGVVGARASMHGWDSDTRICESTAIGFGLVASQGSDDRGATLGGSAFVGISVRDITLVHTTPDQYEEGDNMSVMTEGDIWVEVATAVNAGDQAYYNTSTGEIGAEAGTAIEGSRFMTSADADGLAVLRLDGTMSSDTTT